MGICQKGANYLRHVFPSREDPSCQGRENIFDTVASYPSVSVPLESLFSYVHVG